MIWSRPTILAVAALVLPGCGEPEGPAVRVALQIVRASDDVDTSDITGFLVRVGVEQRAITYDPVQPVAVELTAPPEADTAIVVFGCTLPAGECADRFGDFVGCEVIDLAPSDTTVIATVELHPRDPLPPECLDLVTPRP